MAVSAINSLLHKLGVKPDVRERRLKLLKSKVQLLHDLELPKLTEDVLAEIMKLEPDNIELKANFIKKSFDQEGGLWKAYTENLRFEALAE